MVVLIGGSTHTGKTLLAQRLLERHLWSCLSIDHRELKNSPPYGGLFLICSKP